MADRPKPKPKGERNDNRKNGKATSKTAEQNRLDNEHRAATNRERRDAGLETPWELAKAKRKARRAKDPEVRNRAKKHRAAKKSDAA